MLLRVCEAARKLKHNAAAIVFVGLPFLIVPLVRAH